MPRNFGQKESPNAAKFRRESVSDLWHVVGLVHLGSVESHLPLDDPRPLLVPAPRRAAPGALTSNKSPQIDFQTCSMLLVKPKSLEQHEFE